jgi:ParB family chromosome partitioning protein
MPGMFMISIDLIRPDEVQPRQKHDEAALQELADSIRQLGILQPITVRQVAGQNAYLIISGERRYQGAKLAGLAEVPCWVQEPKDKEILVRQVVENWQRLDLDPYDLADSLTRLRDGHGYTQEEIAQLTGKPQSEISRLLSLQRVVPEIQKEAREGKGPSRRHLVAIAQLPYEEQQEVAAAVREQNLTAVETEQLVSEKRGKKPKSAPKVQFRYNTSKATLVLTFKKKRVSREEILAALAEATAQVEGDAAGHAA